MNIDHLLEPINQFYDALYISSNSNDISNNNKFMTRIYRSICKRAIYSYIQT